MAGTRNSYLFFLWETTGTQETKKSLGRMYPGIPMIVIRNAIDTGIRTFEGLKKLWEIHNIQVSKSKAIGQRKSVQHQKHWTLGDTKRDYRDYPSS